ncbi:YHS domain-containing protein [Acidianus ambivalens]|uniref:YHS domain-containing protein n=1 Tax=Acidianus ambivalens TaxID=2283 RepID=A0A6G1T7Q8_ACIAM|nr:YHS domain-containing protein [Acidianus ambivalens]MQL56634.1 YHS domain-containing protein [Acidianus ambivalens]
MKVICPVCNRLFEAECSPYKEMYNGIVYYFDTEICQLAFRQNPERFVYHCKDSQAQ